MKNKTLYLFLAFVCIGVSASAQHISDTIVLDSVAVCKTYEYFNNGAKREIIDSYQIQQNQNSTISTLLSANSSLILKSYGHSGSASTLSLRGAGASQTQITWEGFPINSITMGEMDLSLVPTQGFNYVAIDHSGSSTNYGSGTFGGVVELRYIPVKQNHSKLQLGYTQGNFGTRKYSGAYSVGTKKIQYRTSLIANKSDGNFTYFDYIDNATTTRNNAEYKGFSNTHTLFIQLHKHIQLQSGIWYTYKNMSIPPIIGSKPNFKETQKDSSFKAYLQLQTYINRTTIIYKTAFFNDFQEYAKTITKINKNLTSSNIHNTKQLHTVKVRRYISDKITADLEIQGNYYSADVSSYKDTKQEFSNAYIGAIQYKIAQFQSNISVRKEFNSHYQIPILYCAGIQYNTFKNRIIWRANTSKKYRTPTFNDLYWEQWGNPNLIPESGITWETGSQQNIIQTKKHVLTTDITYFEGYINNKIIWIPNGAVWNPMNVAQAKIQGIELRAKQIIKLQKHTINNNLGIDWNNSHITKTLESTEMANGHQLYYVPKYNIYFHPQISYKTWNISVNNQFHSQRYYAIHTSLPSYYTLDITIKHSVTIKKCITHFSIGIQNITNTHYELIRSYPIPGRYLEFNYNLIFN